MNLKQNYRIEIENHKIGYTTHIDMIFLSYVSNCIENPTIMYRWPRIKKTYTQEGVKYTL